MNFYMVQSIKTDLNRVKDFVKIVLVAISVYGCVTSTKVKKPNKYYYIVTSGFSSVNKIDTLYITKFSYHSKKDSLFSITKFVLDGNEHILKKYSNIHRSAVDEAHFSYELDDLGIIFSSNFTYHCTERLLCSSDSVNRILVYALGEALFNSEYNLSGQYGIETKRKTIFFDD
jgi:hypothetical protein